jgi:4-amino-4-deoxy-L-arabinose transferase-like glycosyltransferase
VWEVQKIGSTGFPYYDSPRVVQGARNLFALLSVITVLATGASAWLAFRQPAAIFLSALMLTASPLFFYHSWAYLNVDIVAACFATLAVAACLRASRNPSIERSAVVPGALAGLATGGKYTLALAILPVLLGIVFYAGAGQRIRSCLAAIAAMVVAFLVVDPYVLLDIPAFLNGLGFEASHYAGGHPGADGEAGWPQALFYFRHFLSEFGIGGTVLAAIGAVAYSRVDWRRALILLSLPLALLWLLVSNRVHFTRNVLGLHPIVAMFAAYGTIAVYAWVTHFLARRAAVSPRRQRYARVLVAVLLVVAAVPLWHVSAALRDRTDSRNVARVWIETRLPREWTIVVPQQLGFDVRALQAAGRSVKVVEIRTPEDTAEMTSGVALPAVGLIPHWGFDSRFPGGELADALNRRSKLWHVEKTFGVNPVLVNYSYPNPSGNPAFDLATLEGARTLRHD